MANDANDVPCFKDVWLRVSPLPLHPDALMLLRPVAKATIEEIFRKAFQKPETRVNSGALHLSAEMLRLFVVDAIHRAGELAKKDEDEGIAAPDAIRGQVDVRHALSLRYLSYVAQC